MDASAAVAEAAKTNVVEAYTQATRMRLIVKINAPIIIVPVASDSLEAIAIDLGHLNISNSFVDIQTQVSHYCFFNFTLLFLILSG
jgi:vacuolar protein sorting-associated protein 13A/C